MVQRKISNNDVVFVNNDVVFVNIDVVLTNTDAVLTFGRHSQGFSTALKVFPNGIIPKKVGMKKEIRYSIYLFSAILVFLVFLVFLAFPAFPAPKTAL